MLKQLGETRALQINCEVRVILAKGEGFYDDATMRIDLGERTDAVRKIRQGAASAPISDIEVAVLLQAARNHRSATMLAPLRTTIIDGQSGHAQGMRKVRYVSHIMTTATERNTTYEQGTDHVEFGQSMTVDGRISEDGESVMFTFRPMLAHLKEIKRIPFDQAPANQALFMEQPVVETWQTEVTATLPDKHVLLVSSNQVLSGFQTMDRKPVPGPFDVLVLIKPTIIDPLEEAKLNFPGLQQNPSQFNIGR